MSITSPLLDNLRVVLVEPQGPLNIGSACRAMKNFGLKRLFLVRPGCKIDLEASKMAMHSTDILSSAVITKTIPEAVGGSVLVLGTSNRRGEFHEPSLTVEEGINRIAEVINEGPVSILFGREEWGLTCDDLQYAMGTMRIVTDPENTSLNLSQAVLLIAYEIYQKFGNKILPENPHANDPFEQPPSVEELSRLYAHMKSVLTMCEFLPDKHEDVLMQVIKAFIHRAKPNRREVNIAMGAFSNLRGFMRIYAKKPC